MAYIYLASLLVSLGMLLWMKIFDVRNSVTQFTTLLIIVVTNLGYYFVSTADNLGQAIVAQKIAYVGGIFLPVFYFFIVLEVCHINHRRLLGVFLVLIQCVLYGFVCTIGKGELYYKSIGIHVKNGNVVLDKVYGPIHMVYLATLYFYLLASICVAIHSLVKNATVNRRGILAMVLFASGAVGTYLLQKVVEHEYDIMPIVFVILMIGALIPIYDSNLYTVYENTDIINEQLGKVGFLTFDKNRIYKGCNNYMAKVFPELSGFRIGQKIEYCSEKLLLTINQITELEELYKNSTNKEHIHIDIEPFMLNDHYYAGIIHGVTNSFNVLKGYTIELRDETEHYKALALKENYNEQLSNEVSEKTKQIRYIQQKTILGMAQMVESRDLSTGGHIKRTSDVVRIFSQKLLVSDQNFDAKFLDLVIRSAPMHDLGKIGVDDAILRKQGRFEDDEYNKMKEHSEIGYHMVSEILSGVEEPDFVRVAENVAHYHHEKMDGTGYPHGLKGEEIPVEARIMALADVFDALVSKRCYKEAYSYNTAFDIIKKDSGTHFDEKLAEIFISCRAELEDYYNKSEG